MTLDRSPAGLARRRRVLRRRRRVAAAVVASVVIVLVAGGLVLANLGDPPPRATVRSSLSPSAVIGEDPSGAAVPPWPATGEAAVAVPALGYTAASGPETPVPVASLAKIMTAYVVLRDHPLRPRWGGPPITVTAGDAYQFGEDTVSDQANVELSAGETLTERQMLEGLLVHSANDLAFALAGWDSGSVPAFVGKMNAAAVALGMRQTHFVDASGFDPASVSTAADLLKVAARCMDDRAFTRIVRMPSVSLPLAGTVASYTPLLGTAGVVGVKSGFTSAAGGGDVLAYATTVDGRPVTTLAAVTSQEGPGVLESAGRSALALAQAVAGKVTSERVVSVGQRVGSAVVGGTR
ncbi:MAG: D-alanyl-D-alanine carboxypeptidase family protein, partial [Acidimicrobiales bacterium]